MTLAPLGKTLYDTSHTSQAWHGAHRATSLALFRCGRRRGQLPPCGRKTTPHRTAFAEPADPRPGVKARCPVDNPRPARHGANRRGPGLSRPYPLDTVAGRSGETEAARRAARPAKAAFIVGFLTGYEIEWLPEVLGILRDELHKTELIIHSSSSPELTQALLRGKIDVAFLRPDKQAQGLEFCAPAPRTSAGLL